MVGTDISSRFSERDRELQARYAVLLPHRELAGRSGLRTQTVSCLASAIYPISLFRAVQFADIQGDYRLLKRATERVGSIFLPRRSPIVHWRTMQLIGGLTLFPDAEMHEFEETWEKMKQAGDALVEQARQKRREQDKE